MEEDRQRLVDNLSAASAWAASGSRCITHDVGKEKHNKDPVATAVKETEDLCSIAALLGVLRRSSEDTEVEVVRAHESQGQTAS